MIGNRRVGYTIRFVTPLVVASLMFSCTASQHAGEETVAEPAATQTDTTLWFRYYEDQFDAHEGIVAVPGSQDAGFAHQGYALAKAEWERRVQLTKGRTMLLYVCGGIVGGVGLIYLLGHLLHHNNQPVVQP